MKNRYFTPSTTHEKLNDILSVCNIKKLAPISINGLKGVCKLPLGFEVLPDCLIGVTEFIHKDMITELQKDEWLIKNEFI